MTINHGQDYYSVIMVTKSVVGGSVYYHNIVFIKKSWYFILTENIDTKSRNFYIDPNILRHLICLYL